LRQTQQNGGFCWRFVERPSNSSVVDSGAGSISDSTTWPRGKDCHERHNLHSGQRKLEKVMLSLKNFLVILETKEVFQMILLPLCLLQNINVSQEMATPPWDWCNQVLHREIQNDFFIIKSVDYWIWIV
jgi:hypothetical protein